MNIEQIIRECIRNEIEYTLEEKLTTILEKFVKEKPEKKFLTINEAADMARVKPFTIRFWLESGKVVYIQPTSGGKIIIETKELLKFLKKNSNTVTIQDYDISNK